MEIRDSANMTSLHCISIPRATAASVLLLLLSMDLPRSGEAHGFLSEPKSRQIYAAENGKWWCPDPTSEDCFLKESEPWSASRLASGDFCGTIAGSRSYTYPRNMAGQKIQFPVQATYEAGSVVSVDMVFTAYHGGHVEFYLCDDANDVTQECFDKWPLHFDESVEHYDPNYPERLYLDPLKGGSVKGLVIPDSIECDRCVLRWVYVTANSCLPPGYRHAPAGAVADKNLPDCALPFDTTGNSLPERFWNCADVRIEKAAGVATPAPTTAFPDQTGAPTTSPTAPAPTTGTPTEAPAAVLTPSPTQPTSGSCTWEGCYPGTSGPCKNTNGFGAPLNYCFELDTTTGRCWQGTSACDEASATPAPTDATTSPPPSSNGTPAPTQPTATGSPTPAPTTSQVTAPPSTPSPEPCSSACNSEGSWSDCFGATSGPCQGPDKVCYQPWSSGTAVGQCYANTQDCRKSTNCPTPPARETSAPTPASTIQSGSTPSPATPAPTNGKPAATAAPTPSPTAATKPSPAPPSDGAKKFVMYYESWATYQRDFQMSDMDFSTITHLNFAFANIANGRCVVGDSYADTDKSFPGDSWDQPLRGHFNQLQKLKAQHPHIRALISVGGWTWSKDFPAVAKTAESRRIFAESCTDFMVKYGFDGIDIDWEYPVEGGLSPSNDPSDRENYTLLLKALRAAMDGVQMVERPLLTIASSPNPNYVKHMELAEFDKVLDWVNVMLYDYNGAWMKTAAHNTPLYNNPDPRNPYPEYNIDTTVKAYLAAGLSRSKLVMGMETIGRAWKNIPDGLFSTCTAWDCVGPGTWLPGGEGVLDYKDIRNNYVGKSGYTRYWDTHSMVPYLYNKQSGVLISYDDEESICIKSNYLMDEGLGGAMVWAASSDANHELQHVIHKRVISNQSCQSSRRRSNRRLLMV